jgi:P pilus assembly chaperone PapD
MHTSEFLKNQPAYKQNKYCLILLSGLIAVTLFSSTTLMAQGNLMVFPRRVVFEGTKRSQILNLANTGMDTARYNISIVQYRMKVDGGFEEIAQPDSGENFADKYIRFFPRSVVLAPNDAQVVKIQLTKTNQMSPGEYRSHIYFRAVPAEKPLGEKEALKDSTSISIKLVPVFGITVPVIIRVGESTARVRISNVSLEMVNDTMPVLTMAFNRTGNMSVYGDIAIDYISPKDKVIRVNFIQGLAVYTPIPVRRLKIDIDKTLGIDFSRGKFHIVYTSQSDTKPEKLAEAELLLH